LEEGASPSQVDKALKEYGMAMGPFEVPAVNNLIVTESA
jgi:3-hydroxyacyl-CoA dehydrogenase